MLKFKTFQGTKMGLLSAANSQVALERAAEGASKWMSERDAAIKVSHITAAAPGNMNVAHVVVWYEAQAEKPLTQ